MVEGSFEELEADPFPRKRSPLVLVGALATAGVLVGGLVAFRKGNKSLSQSMMRARVLVQGGTVAIMLATSGSLMASRHGNASQKEE